MMFIYGVFVAILGVSAAINMTGCKPSEPMVIDGRLHPTGDIYSPGYREGLNYPNDCSCQFIIQAPQSNGIKLEFKDLDIEPYDLCSRDVIELTIGLSQERYCGNQTYPPIQTSYNEITIAFNSDFLITHRGFHIHYEVQSSWNQKICNIGQHVCRNRYCFTSAQKCDGKDDCGDGTDEENCDYPAVATECGLRNATKFNGHDRIVGGQEAQPGSWPWQADLQISFIHPNGHICGGTLISPQWVLSAAHCVAQIRNPSAFRIHLGNHHKFKKDKSEQVRYVEQIVVYPGTTEDDQSELGFDMNHDISLMKLNAPVNFTDSVRTACLPPQGYELPVGTKCMASGWGMTRGTGSYDVLKEVELTVQEAKVCDGAEVPFNAATMICVKNSVGFQDVCHGDSGGPLVCEFNGKWHVMGATSLVTRINMQEGLCAVPGSASIYAKVSPKRNWIIEQVNK